MTSKLLVTLHDHCCEVSVVIRINIAIFQELLALRVVVMVGIDAGILAILTVYYIYKYSVGVEEHYVDEVYYCNIY
jgi:hypothetical protein